MNQVKPRCRFKILKRDGFTCVYCGAKPGNDRLQADHLVPASRGGSDHPNNLVCACDRCNNGKSDSICIPQSLCEGSIDRDGWVTWKRWGQWHLKFDPEDDRSSGWGFVLSNPVGFGYEYWFALERANEGDWERHLGQKLLPERTDVYADFIEALEFARTLII